VARDRQDRGARPDQLRGGDLVFRARAPGEDVDSIYAYIPVRIPGDQRGAVELRESLSTERAFVRAQIGQAIVTTIILALVCGLIATALGIAFVGRPVRQLVEQARRIGSGDLSGRLALRQRDEIGDLGTEMNAMSQRLAEARDQLQAETAARLRTLDQLRHADRLTTVGKLAAGVAHEVGTPLNVITGHAQLVIDDTQEPAARENAIVITQQAKRVTEIVRQLLDFARPRKPRKDRIEVGALCRNVALLLDPIARKRGVTTQFELGDVEIHADAAQLQQVLTNLIMNAVHAMPDGGTLVLGATADADHAQIWVRDTGTGIPEDVVPHIFEPFYTTKDIGEGTGLGLSVAYGIIVEHGGRIEVDTALGRGTTFTISLPRNA
jgi:two-component system, NtrC family, sensor kinase